MALQRKTASGQAAKKATQPKGTTGSQAKAPQQGGTDAAALLKADHRKVEQLFQQFENASSADQKQSIAEQVCKELVVHTILEEEIFYPACREAGVEHQDLDEAQIEHDSAKVLISDIRSSDPDEEVYAAKVKVLSEYIKHHVSEEEKRGTGIIALAQKAGVDLQGLGQQIASRKQRLEQDAESVLSAQPRLRALHVGALRQGSSNEEYRDMARNSNYRERDQYGRFTDDDDDGRRGGRGRSGWYGDSEGHSQAARSRSDRYSQRDDDDDDRRSRRYARSRDDDDEGRGWHGDPRGHSEAAHRGWEHREGYGGRGYNRDDDDDDRRSRRYARSRDDDDDDRDEGRGWHGDPRGHAEAAHRGWEHREGYRGGRSSSRDDDDDDDRRGRGEGRGWYGDSRGHAQASRRGWDERGSYRGRDEDDDDDRRGRGGGHGGWFGDPEGHSAASRRGWRNRD